MKKHRGDNVKQSSQVKCTCKMHCSWLDDTIRLLRLAPYCGVTHRVGQCRLLMVCQERTNVICRSWTHLLVTDIPVSHVEKKSIYSLQTRASNRQAIAKWTVKSQITPTTWACACVVKMVSSFSKKSNDTIYWENKLIGQFTITTTQTAPINLTFVNK